MSELAGKRIIVTGAAAGMGESAARAFVEAGARVACLDIAYAPGQRNGDGAQRTYRCDVSSRPEVDEAVARAAEWLGGLDAVVHAAGVVQYKPAEELDDADIDRVIRINLMGTIYVNQAVFPHLKERGGKILNFSSASGIRGTPLSAHYCASKGAVGSWTRTIAQEWAPHNITVNAVAPVMMTPMSEETMAPLNADQLVEFRERFRRAIPLGGWFGDPDRDLSPFLVFLMGEGSRFMTGQTFAVDGGCVMMAA